MAYQVHDVDCLRFPSRACVPDPRSENYVILDNSVPGGTRPKVIDDQYAAIARFQLNQNVPEDVAVQFETSKNLYLYSWFVYRFFPVAEQHALSTLEFALRERFPHFVEEQAKKPGLGLRKLLKHAIDNGYVTNQAFSARRRWAWKRAEARHMIQLTEKMRLSGMTEMKWSEEDVVVTQEDMDADWLGAFLKTIPSIRNMHAHGGPHLMPNVLHSFEVVTEIVNQLYPEQ